MDAYTTIINNFVDEFTTDPEAVRRVVVEAAEKFRSEYYAIVDVEEDEFDKGELEDFYKEVRLAIVDALKDSELL